MMFSARATSPRARVGRSYPDDVYPTRQAERRAQSPRTTSTSIKAPMMLVHGDKDVRVPIKQHALPGQQLK